MTIKLNPYAFAFRSRGAVLPLVLIVLVVMMLGGVALVRSLDTSAMLSGNLAFKRESLNRTTVGLSAAFLQIKSDKFKNYSESSTGCDSTLPAASCTDVAQWLSMNYSPRLLETDGNGVPLILKDKTRFDAKFNSALNVIDRSAGSEVRFLIERMCNGFGPSNEKMCVVSDHFERGGSYRQEKPGAASLPMYRVTIRSDGVRNTQTYAQAIVTTRVK